MSYDVDVSDDGENIVITVGAQGPQGNPGPQGPQGVAGPQGPAGPQGVQGNDGPRGLTGPEGPVGPQGAVGPKGSTGDDGPRGPQGPTGAQGPRGPAGPRGPKGEEGSRGPGGWQGASVVDARIVQRELLIDVYDPATGITTTLNAGNNTGPGLEYIWNGTELGVRVEGDSTYTYMDLEGERGPKGDKGDEGPQGEEGPRGPKGDTGSRGPEGPQGEQGPEGPEGPKGDKGDPGEPGADGADGEQGPPGADGVDGVDGAQGPAGPGLPTGGAVGQIPVKASATDFDTEWQDLDTLPEGGTTGQVLSKVSDDDGDAGWTGLANIAVTGSADDLTAGTVPDERFPGRLQGAGQAITTTAQLDALRSAGFYHVSTNASPTGNYGMLLMHGTPSGGRSQLFTDTVTHRIYTRSGYGTGTEWSAWGRIASLDEAKDYTSISELPGLSGNLSLDALLAVVQGGVAHKAEIEDISTAVLSNISTVTFSTESFTPTVVGSSADPTVTYAVQHGRYVKLGNLAYVEFRLSWAELSGGSGSFRVRLPSALEAGNSEFSNVLATRTTGLALSGNNTAWHARARPGSHHLDMVASSTDSSGSTLNLSAATDGGNIAVSGIIRLS